jgi:hypothetical protein
VVGSSALGAMECGNKGAEERGERRAEWCCSADIMERGETVSPTDRQHDGGARGGGCMHGAWSRRGSVEPIAGGHRQRDGEWRW